VWEHMIGRMVDQLVKEGGDNEIALIVDVYCMEGCSVF
jgi:hypothetical protein